MWCGYRVKDEIKPISKSFEVLRIFRNDKVVRAKAERILFFCFGCAENCDLGAPLRRLA
jgi:hypothetical protein